jgi:uncharacterized protein YcfL
VGRYVSVIAALSLAMVVGCGWRGPSPVQTFPGVASSVDVVALDKAAWQLVAVQNRSVTTAPDGRLTIKLELANLSSLDLDVQVQTFFRDAEGLPVRDNPPFEMIVLPGSGSRLYQVSSLQPHSGSFTVQIKTP